MGRARHQHGYVELTKTNHWQGHWYIYAKDPAGAERRVHRSQLLGSKSSLRKFEAEEKLRTIIAATSSPAAAARVAAGEMTFREFMERNYIPMRGASWRQATRRSNTFTLEKYVYPAVGELPLQDITKFTVQMALNDLATRGYSYTVVYHARDLIKAALAEALDQEILERNVARKTQIPEIEERDKHVLPIAMYPALLAELTHPRDRVVFMVACFCTLRPSEIFGLTWQCDQGEDFLVINTAYRGQLQLKKTKKRGKKGKTNCRLVAIPAAVRIALDDWRKQCTDKSPGALLFPGRGGKPMDAGNWLRLHVQPLEESLRLPFHINFQILRRSFATHGQKLAKPKEMQAHLGHGDIKTTLEIYTQEVHPNVRAMANAVTDQLLLGDVPGSKRIQ